MSNGSKSDVFSVPLVAGLLGGSASTALLYPLDLVKVRLQVNENSRIGAFAKKRTIIGTMRHVVKYEGVVGVYQGLAPALIGSAASWGGYFFFYELGKKKMMARKRKLHNIQPTEKIKLDATETFSAACMSGAVMVCMTNPLWLIKTRMQLQMKRAQEEQALKLGREHVKRPYRNMLDALRTIVREEGVLALYKGGIPALMLVSHGGVQFVTYEFLKGHLGEYTKATRSNNTDQSGVYERLQDSLGYLSMGAVSKIIASTITYPIQVIKSRLQQRNQTAEISATGEVEIVTREYKGVIDCAGKIWKREGVAGFFKGSIPNAIRVAPSAAITFVTYEMVTDSMTSKSS